MSNQLSPATNLPYRIAQICRVWGVARSTFYKHFSRLKAVAEPGRRRGPLGPCSDDDLVQRIREVLCASPFHGEGYRKVWARLRHQGLRTSQARVRRLMRQHELAAPYHPKRRHGSKAHDGRITTDRPDEMWGTDATSVLTGEGTATIFLAVDHCTAECIGIHAARRGTRFEALEPIRQGIRKHWGGYEADIAHGLALRHDHGSQFMSHHFQDELKFLGVRSTPAFVAEPECNGVAERFIRTLKEQLLWLTPFDTVEHLRRELLAFKQRYNANWLVQKHNHRTPDQVRENFPSRTAQAA